MSSLQIRLDRPFMGRKRWAPVTQVLAGQQGFAVYRVNRAARGRPLYVGSTCDLLRRLKEHERRSEWWPKAVEIVADYYSTYEVACGEEGAAIREYRPLHNVIGTKQYAIWQDVAQRVQREAEQRQLCQILLARSTDDVMTGLAAMWDQREAAGLCWCCGRSSGCRSRQSRPRVQPALRVIPLDQGTRMT